ncbi:titin-like isoform X2 [Morone saxatilis]|uniref:titin-like isoform X2 n=1 Tax=Morone saxatilis TaxID=34816 RepID=UPI0015E239E6|nr:titin-like isoform X2 [Morone saxatilis]
MKEKVIMTESKTKRKKVVAVQDEPSKQKAQDKKFSVQKTDSPTDSTEIKDIKKEHTEATESPETDQKQVTEPQQVTSEAYDENREGVITQALKDKSKLSVRKSLEPIEKAILKKKLKQTDQEEKHLQAENIESTEEETDSSELVKPTEKLSSKPRIVELKEAEEKLYATPKSARQTTSAKKPVRLNRDSQSSQLTDSQSKQTVEKTGDEEFDDFQPRAVTEKYQDKKLEEHQRKEGKASVKPVMESTKKSESILSKVVTFKDKLVKVCPMEGTTEMKPNRETLVTPAVEVKHPESLSERENITDNNLQKPEILSKGRTLKDVAQKVRRQTVVEDEDRFKDRHVKVSPKEKTKPEIEDIPPARPNAQSKIIRMKDETAEVTIQLEEVTKQEQIKRIPSLTPVIELTHKESSIAGSEKYPKTTEAVQGIVEKEEIVLEVISAKIKPSPTEKRKKSSKPETAENRITKVRKQTKQEQPERKVTDTAESLSEVSETEMSTPESPKLARADDITITLIEETKPRLKQTQTKSPVTDVEEIKPEELKIAEYTFKITQPEVISPKKEETEKERPQRLQKMGKVADKTATDMQKKASIEEQVERKGLDMPVMDKIIDIDTESESVSLREPQQKLTKPQDIIVEQDQLKVSTVKDKTFKVTPLREIKTTQEQFERKISVTPLMEDTSEELEVAPEEHAETKQSEFVAVDEEMYVPEGISQKELISLQEKGQKLAKTKGIDKQIPPKLVTVKGKTKKVNSIKDGTPLKHAKTKEIATEHETFDEEIDTTESKSVSPQEQQVHTKPEGITVEQDQLKVSTVKDKTFKVTPLKEIKTTQEKIERKVLVTPLMEDTSEELEEAPEKLESAAVDEEIHVSYGVPPKINKLQKLPKTEDKIDEKLQSVVLPIKHKKGQTPLTEEKKTNQEHEPLLRVDAAKETRPEEKVKGDTSERKSKKFTVEEVQSRTVAVTNEYGSVTPFEATKIKQEQVERMNSVVPVMEDTVEQPLTTKDKHAKTDIPQHLTSADDVVKDITSRKEKEIIPEESRDNLVPVRSKTGKKVFPIEKKTLKRQEQIHSTAAEAEPEVPYAKFLAEYDPEKYAGTEITVKHKETEKGDVIHFEDKTAKLALLKKKKTEEIQSKSVTVKHEYGCVTLFEVTEIKQEQVKRTLQEFASEKSQKVIDQNVMSDTSKHITVEQAKTKEDIGKYKPEKIEVERKVSGTAKPEVLHEHTSEKLIVIDKTSTVLPVKEKKTRRTQIETVVSPVMEVTKTDIIREKDALKMSDESENKEATQTVEGQMFDKTSFIITGDIQKKKSKSLKEKGHTLDKSTKTSFEEVQSMTVVVKDEYGSVTPFEVAETKQEQIERKFSVAPVMEVASERSLIVKDGDIKLDTLQRYITPDELVKDIASRKENVYKLDDISLNTNESLKDIRVEQVKSKVDRVQNETEKVTPIGQKLPERQEQIQRKASVASKSEVTNQHSLVDASEKLTVMDKTTTVLPAEEMKTRQKQTETKTVVTPVTEVIDTEMKDIQSKKSKEKGHRLDKGTKIPLEEVQSKTVAVKDEYGSVTPFEVTETKREQIKRKLSVAAVMEVASEKHFIVKDGNLKSDTLQRFIIPDKLIKDITSRKEDIYESGEVSLMRHLQSPESAKESMDILTEKQEITDKNTQGREVTSQFKTDKITFVDTTPTKQKQSQQKAQRTAVSHEKTQKTLVGEDAKTEVDHSPRHEEVRNDSMSLKKPDSLKDQGQVTVECIQSKTETIKDFFHSVTPDVETKQEQIERKASRTPVMDVAYEKPLIVKEQDIRLDTLHKYISPVNLEKGITSRKWGAYKSEDISLKKDESTIDNRQTDTVSTIEGTKIQHIESEAAVTSAPEVTSKKSLIGDDRTERYTKTETLKDRVTTKEKIRTMSAEQDFQGQKEHPKTVSVEGQAAKLISEEGMKVKQKQLERQPTVTTQSLIEQGALDRQLKWAIPKEIKTDMIGKDKIVKEIHEKEKLQRKDEQEQIKGRSKEMYQCQEVVEEVKSSEKSKPATKESKAEIDRHRPTAREPSVTDKTKPKMIEKTTPTGYKTDSPECGEAATRKWQSEVEQSFLQEDVQYIPPQEVETISREEGEAHGLQSIRETRILTLEPEGKEQVSPQESSRGI